LEDKNDRKLTITIDNILNYDGDDCLFMTEFKDDQETASQP
jgi:hypothetical protein